VLDVAKRMRVRPERGVRAFKKGEEKSYKRIGGWVTRGEGGQIVSAAPRRGRKDRSFQGRRRGMTQNSPSFAKRRSKSWDQFDRRWPGVGGKMLSRVRGREKMGGRGIISFRQKGKNSTN